MAGALPDPSSWRGRRVLVTGHTGFKGAWLTLWLDRLGAEVTGLSSGRPVSDPSLAEQVGVAGLCAQHLEVDVRDHDRVVEAVTRAAPEVVLHLAAQPLVRRGHEAPALTFGVNVLGTAAVLDGCRAAGSVRAVVVVTSDKCYRNDESGRPFREEDPLGGSDPYSASKAAQEHVATAYRAAYRLPLATARAGNVIGGGDWAADRLVPDAMRAALDGRPLVVRNPGHVRPWQHVLCSLHGYLALAERLAAGDVTVEGPWNFGPGLDDARPVGDVVRRLAELWPGLEVDTPTTAGPKESTLLSLDSSKARDGLGWIPKWDLDRALRETVAWHRGEGDARRRTQAQIEAYERT